jgi:hypothetical protein
VRAMVSKSIIIASISIAVSAYFVISFLTNTGIFEIKRYVTFSEARMTLEEISRWADVIVIGKVGKITNTESFDNGKIRYSIGELYLDIEEELTDNYNDKRIMIKTFGDGKTLINESVQLNENERVLLFLRNNNNPEREIMNGYLVAVSLQKFSIDENNIAHSKAYGSYKLDELISIINSARNI